MKISGGLRRLTVPVSLGGVCAGFVAGVALQLQQAALWPEAVYALMLLLALALAAMELRAAAFGTHLRRLWH